MELTLTMEEFNHRLNSEANENEVWAALRKLVAIEKPEDVAKPFSTTQYWLGWSP